MERSGYSLLELLVALAILLLGLVVLTRLTGLAGQSSKESEELAIVQLASQAKLNELLANQEKISPIRSEKIAGVQNWSLSVEIENPGKTGIRSLHIIAKKTDNNDRIISRFELVRWVTNDRFENRNQPYEPRSMIAE